MPPQSSPEPSAPAPQPDYDFIMSPQKPSRRNLLPNLPGADSKPMRVAYISGGLLVLLIIFVIIKGLFGGGGSYLTFFVNIAQDQQAMIHVADNAIDKQSLAVGTKNFAATAQLSLGSSKTATIKYLMNNGGKIDVKKLNLKVSTATDQQLETALAAATYDRTFREIMNKKLTAYMNDLTQTYKQTKGSKGRALLNDEYNQAQLLQMQLNASTQ